MYLGRDITGPPVISCNLDKGLLVAYFKGEKAEITKKEIETLLKKLNQELGQSASHGRSQER